MTVRKHWIINNFLTYPNFQRVAKSSVFAAKWLKRYAPFVKSKAIAVILANIRTRESIRWCVDERFRLWRKASQLGLGNFQLTARIRPSETKLNNSLRRRPRFSGIFTWEDQTSALLITLLHLGGKPFSPDGYRYFT